MSNYFSNITARSSAVEPLGLAPVYNFEQKEAYDFDGILNESAYENETVTEIKPETLIRNNIENKVIKQEKSFDTTINKQDVSTNNTSNYFLNSIERNEYNYLNENNSYSAVQKNNFQKNIENNNESVIVKKNDTSKKINIIENIENRFSEERIVKLEPSIISNNNTNTEIVKDNIEVHSKNIIQPQNETIITKIKEIKTEMSRLTIGKINVEILPVNPTTTKIINRIVQAQAPTNFQKTSKNVFGLGQL